jgi:4-hydroxybenzoate polyprenyltransferase
MATPKGPIIWGGPPRPPSIAARPAVFRLLDERDAFGGRPKAALFLVHPGPSLLVTLVTLAAAGLALRGWPPADITIRLVLVMLPAQLAIGAANDVFDLATDSTTKPHKPLVRGAASPSFARAVVVVGVTTSLASAATLGAVPLIVTVAGLAAGLGYDVGLKRSPASWLAWWIGICAIPLGAYAAVQRTNAALWWVIPLAGLLSVGLHCANALPDLEGDRAAGIRSLPVWLGPARSRIVLSAAPIAVVIMVLALRTPLHQTGVTLPICAALLGLTALFVLSLTQTADSPRTGLGFPLLAVTSAATAVAWLAALPQ